MWRRALISPGRWSISGPVAVLGVLHFNRDDQKQQQQQQHCTVTVSSLTRSSTMCHCQSSSGDRESSIPPTSTHHHHHHHYDDDGDDETTSECTTTPVWVQETESTRARCWLTRGVRRRQLPPKSSSSSSSGALLPSLSSNETAVVVEHPPLPCCLDDADLIAAAATHTTAAPHNTMPSPPPPFDPMSTNFYEIQLLVSPKGTTTTSTTSITPSIPEVRTDAPDDSTNSAAFSSSSSQEEEELVVKKMEEDEDEEVPKMSILPNTIVVLPNLLTHEDCHQIVQDTERVIDERRGVTTEKWAAFGKLSSSSRAIIDNCLTNHVLVFLEQRLPEVNRRLFRAERLTSTNSTNSTGTSTVITSRSERPMETYWDDPVVIKYVAGNQLAPHEDLRELTIVIPLNPLPDSDDVPLQGGGTRFWRQGTPADDATEDDGVSIQAPPGSGVLFHGNITHSGNAVLAGTRFVLMTSITFDSDEDSDNEDSDDEE